MINQGGTARYALVPFAQARATGVFCLPLTTVLNRKPQCGFCDGVAIRGSKNFRDDNELGGGLYDYGKESYIKRK